MSGPRVLVSESDVIRCLITYTDWWQPTTTSVYQIDGRARDLGDGLHPSILDHLDERAELCRRMADVEDRDRELLVLWYVKQLPVEDISRALRISRRQCFRRRARTVRTLARVDDTEDAAHDRTSA